ncbi:unnamed protein product, partial [Hapterophycus canaliculatus]
AANSQPRRLYHHHREAFASNVDGVLAMRLACKEGESGGGCLRRVMRSGNPQSHVTEAWQLPPPRSRQRDDAAADSPDGGNDTGDYPASGGRVGGAYVGLFRPPEGSGKTSEMGFHMCVAVIPLDEAEGPGAVAEEYIDPHSPSQGRRHGRTHAQEGREDALEKARMEDGPGGPTRRKLSETTKISPKVKPRHRVTLSADRKHSEAMVLLSIVTEGEPETDEEKERGMDADRDAEHATMRRRCLDRLETAAALGFEGLRRRHTDDFGGLSERVHFSLGPSSADGGSDAEAGADGSAGRRNGPEGAGSSGDWSEGTGSSSSESCAAGLPVRTRVSRSGKACTEKGGEGAGSGGGGRTDRTVVDDGLIELMYHYGRYLMISGSRAGGRPLNLQGIWANSLKAKWEGDYHMNINLQMNYWGAHAAGLPECAAPLVQFVERLSDGGRQTAHSYYRAAGWVSHANTDRWGGTAAHGDAVWALCPTCGAWMALHLWEAFEYTGCVGVRYESV